MNGLPYYKAYPRDFIEGTIGMSFEMKCAYRVVLDLIYMQGGDLPDDARYISGLLGCSVRKWKGLRDELISAGKLEVSGEFLTNKRAVFELETLAKLQDNKRENRSRPNKNNDLKSRSSHHTEPEPDTEPKEERKIERASAPEGFAFVGQIVRVRQSQFDKWRVSFHRIPDLVAELQKADDFYSVNPPKNGQWFFAVSRWLERAHREMAASARPASEWRKEPEYRGVL